MDDSDPSSAFFPDSSTCPDLYAVLSLPRTATSASIKSAYRLAALTHHPDRLPPSSTPLEIAAANTRFQQVGFAYAVLKDEGRKERYDKSGRTDEGSGARTEGEWRDYFKELWKGEVNAETLEEFRIKYQGSDEERTDLLAAYETSKGDLDTILGAIMCSTVHDEDRFIVLINAAISSGELKATNAWKKAVKDTKGKERRRAKASKEATEAEAYAKELGVHDKIYGKGAKGKGKGKNDGEEDVEGLRALIQGNQAKRMGSVIDSIEAKYAAKEEAKKAKKGGAGKEEGGKKRKVEVEPTEEEFEKIQRAMEERRNSKSGEPSKRRKS